MPKTIITDERLKERDFTGLYGQLIPHDHWMELWDYDSQRAEHDGIELLAEMDARASDFLHELRYTHEKDNPKKPVNILIVAHAGIGLVFRAITEGHPLNGHLFSYPMLDNGEYVELYF
ncbi:histidine phosphatase family protein [Candidatus Saccharibacteria bacterium]|nr:histidine phosphatase family protein [Candidatus Saccharibacteria bacterium]